MKIVDETESRKQPLDHDENYVSRADIKREIAVYQELGKALLSLSKSQLDRLELDELLHDNLLKAKTIRINSEAHRRQLHYIGKLMRNLDIDALRVKLKNVLNQNRNESALLNVAEKAKDQLLGGGDGAIQTLLEQHPELERQKLRQLVRQANKELAKQPDRPSKSAGELVKYLRGEMSR